ncbi:MAG: helix-turn-helix domain-containing protein [Patescibacteria group bacterium]|nr:hypothetical protein [Patescibacteria group bacterium]MBU2509150.1 hypothetical protein [Patescibacteria group bacterium]
MAKIGLKSGLLELGFSPHEAEVYLALLAHGPCSVGPLVTATRLHRNIVYTELDHLKARKMVSEKQVRGRKRFSVASPSRLSHEFNEKAKVAKDLSELIERQMPKGLPEITVHQGNEEYLSLLTDLIKAMPKGSTKYVLGAGGEQFMEKTMRPIWKEYHDVARPRIKIKMIAYEPQRSSIKPDNRSEDIYEVRYLPAKLENPAGIHIYPEVNTVLNIIYSDATTPVTAIRINYSAFAKSYLQLFNNLWNTARP